MISKKTALLVSGCGLGALVLFFFFDLQIAQTVYSPDTWFGEFFRVAAPVMAPLCGLLFSGFLAREKSVSAGWRVFGLIGSVVYAAIGAYQFFHYIKWSHPAAVAGLAVVLLVGALLLGGMFKADPKALCRAAVTALVMIALVFLEVEILKNIWGRRRFYSMTDPAAEFTRWLFPQGKPASDSFKSFPSGHTANGSAALLLLLLPSVFPKAKWNKTVLAVCVFGWSACVAVSRMLEGAHFASDVTVGFLLAFLTFFAVSRIVFFRKDGLRK